MMTKSTNNKKGEWKMTKKEMSKKLLNAYLNDSYGDYESLNNMIDSIVPEGYFVRTCSDSVEVFESIEDLELGESDLLTLQEDGVIDTDDVNIQIVRN